MEMFPVVVGSSGKLITGHNSVKQPMTLEQAESHCKSANARAENLGIECRYSVVDMSAADIKSN